MLLGDWCACMRRPAACRRLSTGGLRACLLLLLISACAKLRLRWLCCGCLIRTLLLPAGAETGAGGRIRDTHATGIGSIMGAATAGYCVGNLQLDG